MTTFCCERNALFFLAVAERATHARSAALSCQTVLSKENNGFLPGRTHGYDPTHTIIIHCTKRKPHTLGVNAACVGFTYISRNHYKGRHPDSALCLAQNHLKLCKEFVTVKQSTVLPSTLRMCENISKNEMCGCSPLYLNGYNRLQSNTITGVESWQKDYKSSRKTIISRNGHGRLRSAAIAG